MGTKTTIVVYCKVQQSSEANKFRIDESLECVSTFIETECKANDSNCPGMYYLVGNNYKVFKTIPICKRNSNILVYTLDYTFSSPRMGKLGAMGQLQ